MWNFRRSQFYYTHAVVGEVNGVLGHAFAFQVYAGLGTTWANLVMNHTPGT